MATYFDALSGDDLALLPVGLRTATELVRLAGEAERDVIGFYTARLPTDPQCRPPMWGWCYVDLGDGRGVYLSGYEVDATDADDVFAAAMRQTIARVLVWRLQQETRDPATSSEMKAGSTSRTYRESADAPFPRHWTRDLSTYDTRQPAWGI